MLSDFDSVVADMMVDMGGTATLLIESTPVYDPSTGIYEPVETSYLVNTILLDYPTSKAGISSNTGTLIEAGDRQCFVQPRNKVSTRYTMPVVKPNKDKIKINGEIWKILALKDTNPSGANSVLLELHIRK